MAALQDLAEDRLAGRIAAPRAHQLDADIEIGRHVAAVPHHQIGQEVGGKHAEVAAPVGQVAAAAAGIPELQQVEKVGLGEEVGRHDVSVLG